MIGIPPSHTCFPSNVSESEVVFEGFRKGLLCLLLAEHLALDEVGVDLKDLLLVSTRMLMHVQGLKHLDSLEVEIRNELRLRLHHVFNCHFDCVAQELQRHRVVALDVV